MSASLSRYHGRKAGDDEKTLVARAASALAGFEHETKKQCAGRAWLSMIQHLTATGEPINKQYLGRPPAVRDFTQSSLERCKASV
ncbi:hypothetical protein, partial [Pseudomonas viridiflava]|uniref:hypothetical protein n=1 Tax=Pseudomonas viridiflava TaxID=33069 RepID=UPI0013DF5B4D